MMETKSKFVAIVCAAIALAGILGLSMISRHDSGPSMNFRASNVDSSTTLDFEIYNSYTKLSPITNSPWRYLAEPYREATLSILETSSTDNPDRYRWEINGEEKTGSTISHTFYTIGKHSVKVTDSELDQTFSTEVMVKYVRREIRALSDQDRSDTLDALETIYRVSTDEGKALFGDDYRGMDFFLKQHLLGAGLTDCDHWHDDAGIMTHHVAYTLEVEQSMQLVNPTVSMPYWDYTIDDYLYDSDLEKSVVWSDDWFGKMAPDNLLHIITEGRWKLLGFPDAGDFEVVNPYGMLRSPWNVNPTNYITRYNYINAQAFTMGVGCSQIYTAFKMDSLADINEQLNGETHGPVHVRIGGEWDASYENFAYVEGFSGPLVLLAKILWRAGYLRVPDSCDSEAKEPCVASCPSKYYESQGKSAYDVLYDLNLFNYIEYNSLEYDDKTDTYHLKDHWNTPVEQEFYESILNAMCDPGKVGEMYTSAAPADPSFWILHPAAERFLSLRRIVSDKFPLDETWGYTHKTHVASDSGWVCDWSDVKEELDMPVCSQTFACSGHDLDDELELTFINTLEGRTFTNGEFYDFMHPFNEELPYMYDNYDYDHCLEQGYDFFDSS